MPGSRPSASPLSFIYHELWTSDPESRLDFYRDLFGWSIVRETRSDGEFLRIRHGDVELARIVPLDEEDAPDRWNVFLAIPDLDALLGRVEASRGEVLIRTQQLPGLGRAALVMDPLGGVFAALQPDSEALPGPPAPRGARIAEGGPTAAAAATADGRGLGQFVWHDLLTPNLEASSRFYQTCLGVATRAHSPETAHVHRLIRSEGRDLAGLLATNDDEHAALWLPYVAVEDVVATVSQAADAGAQVWLEPTEVSELGTFAVLSDPGRALFAVRAATTP